MTDVRWIEPIRSWIGIVVGVLVSVPASGRLISGIGVRPINVLILVGGLVLLVPSALVRIVAADDGVEIWPLRTRVRWDAIDSFEARGAVAASIRANRHDVRPVTLTVQPIRPRRAQHVVNRLNDELALAKRAS